MIEIFDGCMNLIDKGKFPTKCEKCHEKIKTAGTLIDHYNDEHHNDLDVNMLRQMVGGKDVQNESDDESLELPELILNESDDEPFELPELILDESDYGSFESPELSFIPFEDNDSQ